MSKSVNFNQAGKRAKEPQFKKIVPGPAKDVPIEIDHTRIDVIMVDGNEVPVSRPWLSVAMNPRTRECVSFTLSADAPPLTVSKPLLRSSVERFLGTLHGRLRPMLADAKMTDREGSGEPSAATTITKDRLLEMIADICQKQPPKAPIA